MFVATASGFHSLIIAIQNSVVNYFAALEVAFLFFSVVRQLTPPACAAPYPPGVLPRRCLIRPALERWSGCTYIIICSRS